MSVARCQFILTENYPFLSFLPLIHLPLVSGFGCLTLTFFFCWFFFVVVF